HPSRKFQNNYFTQIGDTHKSQIAQIGDAQIGDTHKLRRKFAQIGDIHKSRRKFVSAPVLWVS
ncbi:MAG: hypothetical protein OXN26_09200, partial [Gammaproteobacteria bacterium]|nr:hypothetical protein [Gammaproteobacteria bacterium]